MMPYRTRQHDACTVTMQGLSWCVSVWRFRPWGVKQACLDDSSKCVHRYIPIILTHYPKPAIITLTLPPQYLHNFE